MKQRNNRSPFGNMDELVSNQIASPVQLRYDKIEEPSVDWYARLHVQHVIWI